MIYNDRFSPINNWPPLNTYPSYEPRRRFSKIWLLVLSIILLVLSVIALVIVFSVENAWFHDSFETNKLHRYGLWRLCINDTNVCDSWFSSGTPNTAFVQRRLEQSKAGINAWQALEIVFLFLVTATLITTILSIIFYKLRKALYYYLVVLSTFSAWIAASIGVTLLFVFGFAVYNVSKTPRGLDWCFYVNLVAVILTVIAAILLSIYDAFLKRPYRDRVHNEDDVIGTFADLNTYPAALSPLTYVIVRRNKKKRNKPYDYPRVLYPKQYAGPNLTNPVVSNTTDYIPNPNHKMLSPYTSIVTTHEVQDTVERPQTVAPYRGMEYHRQTTNTLPLSIGSVPPHPSFPPPPISTIKRFETQYSPNQAELYPTSSYWSPADRSTLVKSISYASEPASGYIQHGIYRPPRLNPIETPRLQNPEERVLHHYTGYDYFSSVDPSNFMFTRHHSSLGRPNSALIYNPNPSYRYTDDFIKTTM